MSARLQAISQGRLMLIVGLCVAAFVLFFPARQLVQQRNDMERLEARLRAVSAENRRLSDEVSRLEDPSQLEALARERLGLVKPGEDAYIYVGSDDTAPAASPASSNEATPVHRSVFSRAWSWLGDLFRGDG